MSRFIPRTLLPQILAAKPPKAVVIYGSRRVGKTRLLRECFSNTDTVTWINGDSPDAPARLDFQSDQDIRDFLNHWQVVVIDEAQRIPNIGLTLKRMVDAETDCRIFVTGSSALTLADGIKESAVGRIRTYPMWPLSISELIEERSWQQVKHDLPWHMVYGLLPAVVNNRDEARDTLNDYINGILLQDIYTLSGIRKPAKLMHLVKLLAANIGTEVSFDGLAREIGLSKQGITDYIDLLEQCFIIKRVNSFSKNLTNELKKAKKIYFCDLGLRNAVLGDFRPFNQREDAGALWENMFFMERLKKHDYARDYTHIYFWRTTTNREIDFVEECDGRIEAFECKLSERAKIKSGSYFADKYHCDVHLSTPDTLKAFL